MTMVYKAVKNAGFNDEQAQVYGERIAEIELNNRDTEDLPGLIIEDSKSELSPLNDYFEWNNEKAGWKWRRHQAQVLLCTIEVQIVRPDVEDVVYTRAFHPVKLTITPQNKDEKSYEISTWTVKERILEDPNLRRQIIDKAIRELNQWREKYNQYTELSTMFDAIQQLRLDIKK